MGTHYRGTPRQRRALDAWIRLIRAADSVRARLQQSLKEAALTESQFGVLDMLEHLGPLGQGEIGRKLLASRANVTTVLDNLERAGLVWRERDSEDRRRATVRLTPSGRARVRACLPGQVRAITQEFSRLSAPEQDRLGRLCRKLGLGAVASRRGARPPASTPPAAPGPKGQSRRFEPRAPRPDGPTRRKARRPGRTAARARPGRP